MIKRKKGIRYRYFVSYTAKDKEDNRVWGNCVFTSSEKLETGDVIMDVQNEVLPRLEPIKDAIMISFQFMGVVKGENNVTNN